MWQQRRPSRYDSGYFTDDDDEDSGYDTDDAERVDPERNIKIVRTKQAGRDKHETATEQTRRRFEITNVPRPPRVRDE